ncbi:MAG: hypothetical protein M3N57_07770 [Actinomycetota bacterium]|nr:hypothetical protein [Actinomycetota bacterium]
MSHADDELLQPSIAARGVPGALESPWDPRSMVYVAFFGGVIAITAIAYLDAQRLAVSVRDRHRIIAIGAVAFAAVLLLALPLAPQGAGLFASARPVRFLGRGVAILAHLVFVRLLAPAARAFEIRDGEYASLWRPGLTAAALGGFAQAILVGLLFAVR